MPDNRLYIDFFDEEQVWVEASYVGQAVAEWDSDAECDDCYQSWHGDLSDRPISGAYRFKHPSGAYRSVCMAHIEENDHLAVCP